jgi:hypothetical protein
MRIRCQQAHTASRPKSAMRVLAAVDHIHTHMVKETHTSNAANSYYSETLNQTNSFAKPP